MKSKKYNPNNFATIWAALAMAAAPAAAQAPFLGDGLPEFLRHLDADGDGVLSPEELDAGRRQNAEQRDQQHHAWDVNQDGILSPEEVAAAQGLILEEIEAERNQRFNDADANGDTILTLDEFAAIPSYEEVPPADLLALFQNIDANADGSVTAGEFNGIIAPPSTPPHFPKPPPLLDAEGQSGVAVIFGQIAGGDSLATEAELTAYLTTTVPPVPEMAAPLFRSMDQNENGQVTLTEYVDNGLPASPFNRLDGNRDGSITREEAISAGLTAALADDMLETLDANDDGAISQAEYDAGSAGEGGQSAFDSMDTNHDGSLTRPELSALGLPTEVIDSMFAVFDLNQDASISRAEFEPASN